MCCIGPALAGNPTQYVMEKCFQHSGWDRRFLSLQVEIEDVSAAVAGMRAMNFRGAVVTGPLQRAILDCLQDVGAEAGRSHLVNCLYRDGDGQWFGEDTIGRGFRRSLPETFDPQGGKVMILGSGAMACAIACALLDAAIGEMIVAGVDQDSANRLVSALQPHAGEANLRCVSGDAPFEVEPDVQLLIHAPESGDAESAEAVPLVEESIRADMLCADTCFGSPSTGFLQMGANRGCSTLQGQQIQVHVWAECVRLWTGSEPDVEIMREALEEYLGL